MSSAASHTSCWSLTVGQRGPFTATRRLIWTASHKTAGSVTQCHLNQDWLEPSLAFALPPSSSLAFFPGRLMNNEWEKMQARALILMELKNRRRTILCAGSYCVPMLICPVAPFFFTFTCSFPIFHFLPSAAGGPRWDNALRFSFSLTQRYSLCSLLFAAVTTGAKGGQWLWNERGKLSNY